METLVSRKSQRRDPVRTTAPAANQKRAIGPSAPSDDRLVAAALQLSGRIALNHIAEKVGDRWIGHRHELTVGIGCLHPTNEVLDISLAGNRIVLRRLKRKRRHRTIQRRSVTLIGLVEDHLRDAEHIGLLWRREPNLSDRFNRCALFNLGWSGGGLNRSVWGLHSLS